MSPDKLVYMANQIARFMESKPRAEGVAMLADHLNDYWEPTMRQQLIGLMDAGRSDLNPLLHAAAPAIRRP